MTSETVVSDWLTFFLNYTAECSMNAVATTTARGQSVVNKNYGNKYFGVMCHPSTTPKRKKVGAGSAAEPAVAAVRAPSDGVSAR